ncbi:PDZ domain-containing protein [Inhella sp.]|uniref:PDZ domain-containing protein n=1 Tax=Inhella sp. TaxID=1921806 RepID=UPI0035B205EB
MGDDGQPGAFVVRLIDIQGIRSPAREAGIEVGDQIVALDQCQVGTAGELTLEIEGIPEGNTTELLVRRRGLPVRKFQVMTHRWRPANPAQARLPGNEQNLCDLLQRFPAKR